MAVRHRLRCRWRPVCVALLVLVAAPLPPLHPAGAQSAAAGLAESGPALEVCTGSLADGSGDDTVQALAFTPDGQQLLVGCKGGAVELRSQEGQLRFRRQPDAEPVAAVAVSPDGQRLMTASAQTVRIWTSSGEPIGQFSIGSAPEQRINALALSSDGSRLLIGEDGAVAGLWTLQGVSVSRFEPPGTFHRASERVVSVAFAPGRAEVAVGHEDGSVRRWSRDGRLLAEVATPFSPLRVVRLTPQGDLMAAGWYGARQWNGRGEPLPSLRQEGSVEALQLLPQGRGVVLAGVEVDPYLEVRDALGNTVLTLQPPGSGEGPLALSPDGAWVVLAQSGRLWRWQLPAALP